MRYYPLNIKIVWGKMFNIWTGKWRGLVVPPSASHNQILFTSLNAQLPLYTVDFINIFITITSFNVQKKQYD